MSFEPIDGSERLRIARRESAEFDAFSVAAESIDQAGTPKTDSQDLIRDSENLNQARRQSARNFRCEFGHLSFLPEMKPLGKIEPIICRICAFGLVDEKAIR